MVKLASSTPTLVKLHLITHLNLKLVFNTVSTSSIGLKKSTQFQEIGSGEEESTKTMKNSEKRDEIRLRRHLCRSLAADKCTSAFFSSRICQRWSPPELSWPEAPARPQRKLPAKSPSLHQACAILEATQVVRRGAKERFKKCESLFGTNHLNSERTIDLMVTEPMGQSVSSLLANWLGQTQSAAPDSGPA